MDSKFQIYALGKMKNIVCDVVIAAELADLYCVHERKAEKYDMPEIHAWMSKNFPGNTSKPNPIATACVCHWMIAEKYYGFWNSLPGLPRWRLMKVMNVALQSPQMLDLVLSFVFLFEGDLRT